MSAVEPCNTASPDCPLTDEQRRDRWRRLAGTVTLVGTGSRRTESRRI